VSGPLELLVGLLAPDAASGAYNDWRLVFTHTWPSWVQVALPVVLAAAVVASATSLSRASRGRRAALIALRALVAVGVLALFLQPAVELRAVSRVRTRVAMLLDTSRSMGLATPEGTRAQAVARHLADSQAVLQKLGDRAVVEPVLFGERTHPVDAAPAQLPTDEGHTDLGRALAEVGWQSAGRELGAIILYSDGADTEGLGVEAARRRAAKLGVPIYAVGFPADSSAPDLAIAGLTADDFAFVYNTVTLDVAVQEQGLGLREVLVTLKRDGTVMQTKPVTLEDGRGRVSFEFKPQQTGKQVYEVSVPVQANEVVPGNNAKSLVLKVIRDRIRVLQVAGRPSWDVRFLREMLKRNPNVDLISFFILRSTTDLQKAPAEELALIPFPVNELFTTELPSFDVVIYQNFSYRPYRMQRFLRNVRDYVLQDGKSFLMIGGDFAFEDGWYAGTEIADILPIRLGGSLPFDPQPFRPNLTPEGRRHPVTLIGEPGEPPQAVYRRLPELAGFNSSVGLLPGAQALLTHPGIPGNPPVVSIKEFERGGRSMAVTTDSLWYWRFEAVADGGAGREFDRFWSNALRWLIKDPELARVRLDTERSVVLKGDPVGAEVQVLGPDYRGMEGAAVQAVLLPVGRQDLERRTVDVTTGPEGKALLKFEGVPPGTYDVRVSAEKDGERIGVAKEPVIVEASDVELLSPFPRPELLRALAEGSGGAYVDIDEPLPDIELEDTRRVEVDRTRRIPVWNTWPAFLALLVVAAAEWWIRRRSGLL
jgi:uncharacterized membrane protein